MPGAGPATSAPGQPDGNRLGTVHHYGSLASMARDARRPMFDLRVADGAMASHADMVAVARDAFETLALGRMRRRGLPATDAT